MGHGAVVVGLHQRHGGPEDRDVVFNWHLDHGLVYLVVDFCHLHERRGWSYRQDLLEKLLLNSHETKDLW